MLSYFKEEAESNFDHAKDQLERIKYQNLVEMYEYRENLARSLYKAIEAELSDLKKGLGSELEISDKNFGHEKLVTSSVCSWAYYMGFGIPGWQPPRFWRKKNERYYNTEYLSLIDDVIATYFEEGGEHFKKKGLEKKQALISDIQNKYKSTTNEVLSYKIVDVIATILLQPKLIYPKNKSSSNK